MTEIAAYYASFFLKDPPSDPAAFFQNDLAPPSPLQNRRTAIFDEMLFKPFGRALTFLTPLYPVK